MAETITNGPRQTPDDPAADKSALTDSSIALGGLLLGIGVLEAEEVMRYLDQRFQRYAQESNDPQ
jgi:hypothetical protein